MKIKEAVNRIESTSKSMFAWENDGYMSPVTDHDLAVNGPVEPEDYAEEMLLN